jgi:Putative auto-transporter adhesin, head GIN domain
MENFRTMKYSVYIIAICSFLITGCAKLKNDITKSVPLEAFNEIEIGASFEIELRESTNYNIEISGSEYFAEKVTFAVVDSVLTLNTDAKGKWLHPKKNKIKLIIDCPALKKCTAYETCNLKTLNPITTHEFGYIAGGKLNTANIEVNNDVCYFWNNSPCGGTITFSGTCNEFKSWGNSLISVNAKNLATSYAYIENKSKNDVLLTVTGILQYAITGKGNIQVFGQPAVVDLITDTGDGQLILH